MHKYDGWFGEFAALVMQMQRVAEPTIVLDDEDEIMDFLETQPATMWEDDFFEGLINRGVELPFQEVMNSQLQEIDYNTRLVGFFYEKKEYKEEIQIFKNNMQYLSNRLNLRAGIVTD